MSGFQQCSHHITTAAYQTVLDMTTHAEILHLLCQALSNISATCPALLRECFAPEDVDQMRSLHLQEMKEFLLRIAKHRVAAQELEHCIADIVQDHKQAVHSSVNSSHSEHSDLKVINRTDSAIDSASDVRSDLIGNVSATPDVTSRDNNNSDSGDNISPEEYAEDYTSEPFAETVGNNTRDPSEYYDLFEGNAEPDSREDGFPVSSHHDGVSSDSSHHNKVIGSSHHGDHQGDSSHHGDHLGNSRHHGDHLGDSSQHSDHLRNSSHHGDHQEDSKQHSDQRVESRRHRDHLRNSSHHIDHLGNTSYPGDQLAIIANHSDHTADGAQHEVKTVGGADHNELMQTEDSRAYTNVLHKPAEGSGVIPEDNHHDEHHEPQDGPHDVLLDSLDEEEELEEDQGSQVVRSVQDYQVISDDDIEAKDDDSDSHVDSDSGDNNRNNGDGSVLAASGTSALQGDEKFLSSRRASVNFASSSSVMVTPVTISVTSFLLCHSHLLY